MSDPTRLTEMTQVTKMTDDGAGVTAAELDLIRAGREARLSPQNKRRLWMGISAMSASASVAATAASGGALLTAVKATILVAAVGGGSIVGYRAWQHRERPAAVPAVETATFAPAPTATATATEPETRGAPPQRPAGPLPAAGAAPRVPSPGVKKAQASRLAAEGGVVLEARRALREGRPEDALRLLEAARTEFAAGALAQEREALAIEALSRSERREAAQTRAAAFLRAYPGSPHAASVKSFAGH